MGRQSCKKQIKRDECSRRDMPLDEHPAATCKHNNINKFYSDPRYPITKITINIIFSRTRLNVMIYQIESFGHIACQTEHTNDNLVGKIFPELVREPAMSLF